MEASQKPKKSKSFIRFEAIIPFAIVIGLIAFYMIVFFDFHLRKSIELGGYYATGAELNVADLKTSFIRGNIVIKGIQLTNPDKPTHNSLEISEIRFGILWDALLRAKFVVNEMTVEGIAIDTKRKSPGKVKPPEPPKVDDGKPSVLEKEAIKLKNEALKKTQEQYSKNVLGDLAAILSGGSAEGQLTKLEDTLISKKRAQEIEAAFKEKQKIWNEKINALPGAKEASELSTRLSKVKTKDFKTPEELQNSIKEIESIVKEADSKIKQVRADADNLGADVKSFEQQVRELEEMIKKDIADLEQRFRLPNLDPKAISYSLFQRYAGPYLAKANHYQGLAEKYIPPGLMKKNDKDETVQPHPRSKGVSYEFGKPNAYPLFWIKKVAVSSKASPTLGTGDLSGQIVDITSNQRQINKPTVASFAGSFPSQEVRDLKTSLTIDNRGESSLIKTELAIGSYAIDGSSLVESDEVNFGFDKAFGSLNMRAELRGLRNLVLQSKSDFSQIQYKLEAKNKDIELVLKEIFAGIPTVDLNVNGEGLLPNFPLSINSNLGNQLVSGIEGQVNKKIAEAKQKIEQFVNQQVSQEKEKIQLEINKFKNQLEAEVKKAQDSINQERTKVEKQVEQAKKEFENQNKKALESEIKKAIGPDADKKIEDLKKKLGF